MRTLADGQVYTGRQALNLGLVDQLGGYEEALATLRNLIGDQDIPVDSGRAEVENFILRFLQSQVSGFTQELRALTSPILNSRLPSRFSPLHANSYLRRDYQPRLWSYHAHSYHSQSLAAAQP
ncbi:MAG: hypothetical protein HC926_03595 [Synechococcaceae cyanobacterium SM2_3_60]|nr:hypothetical protein [Synechococcaceae cyanobacterium SM2_3_60]